MMLLFTVTMEWYMYLSGVVVCVHHNLWNQDTSVMKTLSLSQGCMSRLERFHNIYYFCSKHVLISEVPLYVQMVAALAWCTEDSILSREVIGCEVWPDTVIWVVFDRLYFALPSRNTVESLSPVHYWEESILIHEVSSFQGVLIGVVPSCIHVCALCVYTQAAAGLSIVSMAWWDHRSRLCFLLYRPLMPH